MQWTAHDTEFLSTRYPHWPGILAIPVLCKVLLAFSLLAAIPAQAMTPGSDSKPNNRKKRSKLSDISVFL
ncbi:MAG: hypothetical protein QNJ40_25775 [Xanthomonadales bacterium]|nr:hypothetical protein [Xanthomonadales bacterium]